MNFAKFLRTPFSQNTSRLLFLDIYYIIANEISNDITRKIELEYCKTVINILLDNIVEDITTTNGASIPEMDYQSFNEAVNPISDNDTSFAKK